MTRLFLRSFCRFWNPGPDKMLPLPRLLTPRQVTKCYACHENRQCSILRMSQSAINKSMLFAMKSASSASSRNHVVSAAQRGEAYCSALTANGCGRSSNAGRTRLYLHSSTKTLRYAFGKTAREVAPIRRQTFLLAERTGRFACGLADSSVI